MIPIDPQGPDTQNDWDEITNLFSLLSELPESERNQKLQVIEASDPKLFKELQSLLDYNGTPTPALDTDFISVFCALKGTSQDEFLGGPPRLVPGDRIDDFEIIHEIGHGTFAIVYLAKQISLAREVALKVSYDLGDEAQVLAHLEHDNIIKVYSEKRVLDEKSRTLRLICMQYIAGVTLESLLEYKNQYPSLGVPQIMDALTGGREQERAQRNIGTSAAWVVQAITSLANALTYAHRRGVLHLDIKPSNILIAQDGKAYLMDFNVARKGLRALIDGSQVLGGTQRYMAPEQQATFSTKSKEARRLLKIDHRADIYSFGRVVLEICQTFGELSCNQRLIAIANKAAATDVTIRFPLTLNMAQAFRYLSEQARSEEKLKKEGPISRFSDANPLWAMLALVILPQFVGSLFNIAYNQYQIVRHLSIAQQATFQKLISLYNPIVYSILLAVGFLLLRPAFMSLVDLQRGRPIFMKSNLREIRKNMLKTPWIIFAITTMGWVPACFFFPAGLNLMSAGGNFAYSLHFILSIGISWLIALSYSFLGMKFLTHYILYPKYVGLEESLYDCAKSELSTIEKSTSVVYIMGGAMPLFSAMLLLLIPYSTDSWGFDIRLLTASLILCGTIGFVLSIFAALRITKASQVLSNQS